MVIPHGLTSAPGYAIFSREIRQGEGRGMLIESREDIAKLIKTKQIESGINSTELAKRLGISTAASISRTINKSDLAISQIQRIANAMGYKVNIEFMTDKEQ